MIVGPARSGSLRVRFWRSGSWGGGGGSGDIVVVDVRGGVSRVVLVMVVVVVGSGLPLGRYSGGLLSLLRCREGFGGLRLDLVCAWDPCFCPLCWRRSLERRF